MKREQLIEFAKKHIYIEYKKAGFGTYQELGGLEEFADAILALESEQIEKYKELVKAYDLLKEQIIKAVQDATDIVDGTVSIPILDHFLDGILNEQLRQLNVPSDENAGIIAVNIASAIEPKLTAQEEVFFVAGFKECVKYLRMQGKGN